MQPNNNNQTFRETRLYFIHYIMLCYRLNKMFTILKVGVYDEKQDTECPKERP